MRTWVVALVGLAGCAYVSEDWDGGPAYDGGGGYGAIGGGAQDIGYARDLVAQGVIPDAEAFPVEGLLAEHDMPTEGGPCPDLLCARPAMGWAPSLATGDDALWVQMGMTSGLAAPYERPPLDLVFVIDTSSSMTGDLGEVERAVEEAISHMGPDDRLAVVAFADDVHVLHDLGRVDDPDGLVHAVLGLDAGGNWDLMAAMHEALDQHEAVGDNPGRLRRIALLTCGYPTVSSSYTDPFSRLVAEAALEGIGTSIYGVLLGWDANVADLLGDTRGGSYHYLTSLELVEGVFDEDFDLQMSPIAYDLKFGLTLVDGVEIDAIYGVPGTDDPTAAVIEVTTAFLSRNRGAVLARLSDPEVAAGVKAGSVSLSYVPDSAHGLDAADDSPTHLVVPATNATTPRGVRKGAALANEAEGLADACARWHAGDEDQAIAKARAVRDLLVAERDLLQDSALDREIALATDLLALMQD